MKVWQWIREYWIGIVVIVVFMLLFLSPLWWKDFFVKPSFMVKKPQPTISERAVRSAYNIGCWVGRKCWVRSEYEPPDVAHRFVVMEDTVASLVNDNTTIGEMYEITAICKNIFYGRREE